MIVAYAEANDLAIALNIEVSQKNAALLDECLNAAATEINHHLELATGTVEIDPGLLRRVNVNRAVEWYRAPGASNAGVGYEEIGQLPATLSGFERHADVLLPHRRSWGVA